MDAVSTIVLGAGVASPASSDATLDGVKADLAVGTAVEAELQSGVGVQAEEE